MVGMAFGGAWKPPVAACNNSIAGLLLAATTRARMDGQLPSATGGVVPMAHLAVPVLAIGGGVSQLPPATGGVLPMAHLAVPVLAIGGGVTCILATGTTIGADADRLA